MYKSVMAGEKATTSGLVRCRRCHQALQVDRDQVIPQCPECGNDVFDSREGPGLPV